MDPRQAELTQKGAAVVALHLRNDVAIDQLLGDDLDLDALLFVALVAEDTWMLLTGAGRDEIWEKLPAPNPHYPSEMIDRDLVISIAQWLRDGVKTSGGERTADQGTVFLSALDLAASATAVLASVTGKRAFEWCQLWALGAAAGEGVDEG